MTQQSLVPELPEPLVPADCNLRDFPEYRVDVDRLRRSKAWLGAKRNPAIGFYQLNLWTAAWHELPCGSIENDDDVLADRAMCSPETWVSVRDDVLRGWLLCGDGRLYHPTVCEKALEGWIEKLNQRRKSGAGNAAKYGTPFDPGVLTEAIRDCFARLQRLRPQSKLLERREALEALPAIKSPVDRLGTTRGSPTGVPKGSLGKGRVEKGREKKRGSYEPHAAPAAPTPPESAVPDAEVVACIPLVDGTEFAVSRSMLEEWSGTFPAVDVGQQLRNMRAWSIAHTAERKTRNGVVRFITTWLIKEQNKGGAARTARNGGVVSDAGRRTAENIAAAERRIFGVGGRDAQH